MATQLVTDCGGRHHSEVGMACVVDLSQQGPALLVQWAQGPGHVQPLLSLSCPLPVWGDGHRPCLGLHITWGSEAARPRGRKWSGFTSISAPQLSVSIRAFPIHSSERQEDPASGHREVHVLLWALTHG